MKVVTGVEGRATVARERWPRVFRCRAGAVSHLFTEKQARQWCRVLVVMGNFGLLAAVYFFAMSIHARTNLYSRIKNLTQIVDGKREKQTRNACTQINVDVKHKKKKQACN